MTAARTSMVPTRSGETVELRYYTDHLSALKRAEGDVACAKRGTPERRVASKRARLLAKAWRAWLEAAR